MNATQLTCPECGAHLILKPSRYGLFYGCEMWPRTGCKGSHGAHPDGSPLGTPASQATKRARILAHEQFDRLWKNAKSRSRKRKRTSAYKRLAAALGMTIDECHFGSFDAAMCARAQTIVESWLAERKADADAQRARARDV